MRPPADLFKRQRLVGTRPTEVAEPCEPVRPSLQQRLETAKKRAKSTAVAERLDQFVAQLERALTSPPPKPPSGVIAVRVVGSGRGKEARVLPLAGLHVELRGGDADVIDDARTDLGGVAWLRAGGGPRKRRELVAIADDGSVVGRVAVPFREASAALLMELGPATGLVPLLKRAEAWRKALAAATAKKDELKHAIAEGRAQHVEILRAQLEAHTERARRPRRPKLPPRPGVPGDEPPKGPPRKRRRPARRAPERKPAPARERPPEKKRTKKVTKKKTKR